jgi:lipopolysaccharide/colanic/teichoic acid biosynthesis glycosyltransferase
MNEFFSQKITFLLGYIVIVLTVLHIEVLINLKNINFVLLGFAIPIHHLIYFHLSLLGISVLFYSLYFIKENRFKLTLALANIFYALSFILVLGFLFIYSINHIFYYLSNFLTAKFLILLALIFMFLLSIYLSILSVRDIKNLAQKIKTDINTLEGKDKKATSKSYLYLKYLIDKVMSIILILYALPILIVSTILIFSQTKGQIIHRQTRIGKNGRRFKLLKFLTTRQGEDEVKLLKIGKIEFGKVLRVLYIDELPIFFNLLKGNISLVGPRPMQESEFENVVGDSFKELYESVKPGLISLTSLIFYWQDLNESDRHKIETFYITNRNMKLDLRILLTSVLIIIFSKSQRN